MLAPWAPLVVSDPVKLQPARRIFNPLVGEDQYELALKPVLTEDLATLDAWERIGHKAIIKTRSATSQMVAMPSGDDACVRKDYGAAFFGDFTSDFDLIVQGASSNANGIGVWGVSAGGARNIAALLAAADGMVVAWYSTGVNHALSLYDMTGGPGVAYDTGVAQGAFPVTFYCRVNRAGNVWTLSLYTTAARNVLVGSVNCIGPVAAYQYMYAGLSRGAAPPVNYSFTTGNLTVAAGGASVDFNDGNWWILSGSNVDRVALAAGVVALRGSASGWNHTGILLLASQARRVCCLEAKVKPPASIYNVMLALWNASALSANGWGVWTTLIGGDFGATGALWSASAGTAAGYVVAADLNAATFYTLRSYFQVDPATGRWNNIAQTIQGGAFAAETTVANTLYSLRPDCPAGPLNYLSMQQWAADFLYFKEIRWRSGYPIDGPTGVMVADAGAGKFFIKFTPTNITATGGWATTNALFQYSYDDGVPAWNGVWLTLAQLTAVLVITANHRYLRIAAQANSDGVTQQYLGFVNASDILDVPDVATGGGGNPTIAVNSKNAF